MRRKLFCGVASVSERRRGGASVSLKMGSRIVQDFPPIINAPTVGAFIFFPN